jgi:hypothetical protein
LLGECRDAPIRPTQSIISRGIRDYSDCGHFPAGSPRRLMLLLCNNAERDSSAFDDLSRRISLPSVERVPADIPPN